MLDFLKKVLGQERKEPLTLPFADIPAWLSDRRNAEIRDLEEDTEKDRATIRESAGRLRELIGILLAAQFNDEVHPKLKSIAEKSLPQFSKAMVSALEKPLPDEPEEFYNAAAELLKACIHAMQGQGKYLQAVFPDEMKAVSASVAAIGRSINAMNGPLRTHKEEAARIADTEKLHAALLDLDEDIQKSREKEARIDGRIRDLNERIAAAERESAELERQRTGPELAGREQEIASLRKERDATMQRYTTLSMTASHVLRKAEKVARRQHRPSDEKLIARAMTILSDHTVPGAEGIPAALAAAFVPAKRMIDAGEVILKNREERSLFASEQEFIGEISLLSARYAEQSARFAAAEKAFRSHPVITRHDELVREQHQLFGSLAKEKQALSELTQWRNELSQKVPALREHLKNALGGLSGNEVQIPWPDTEPRTP